MNTINETYINALFADTAYVNLHGTDKGNSDPLLIGKDLTDQIALRLTQPQADLITTNFDVVDQELSATGGFDAVVWRGKADTPYSGKVVVSMRGTQGGTGFKSHATPARPLRQRFCKRVAPTYYYQFDSFLRPYSWLGFNNVHP